MKRIIHVALLIPALASIGCEAKLNPTEARAMIEKKYYSADDTKVECGVQTPTSTQAADGSYVVIAPSQRDQDCVKLLAAASLVTRWPFCENASSDCLAFKPAAKVENSVMKFPCGERSLGEVTSVSTEGKSAKVTYKKTIKVDSTVADKLKASCEVATPKKVGELEDSLEFQRDDTGKWSIKN